MLDLSKAMQGDKFLTSFYRLLEEEMTSKSYDIIARHKEQIEKELEAMRQSVIAGASVRLSRMVQIETMGNKLIIQIERPEEGKN